MRFFRSFFAPTPGFPFLAIFFVVVALSVVYSIQFKELIKQNQGFEASIATLTPVAQKADVVINTMVAVGNDLLGMVDTSPVARDIVYTYKLREGNVPSDK